MATPNAHAVVTASGYERWSHCTAAPRYEEGFPERETSVYALEGTLAHSVCELYGRKYFTPMSTRKFNAELKKFKAEKLWQDEMVKTAEFYREEVVMLVSRKLFTALYGSDAPERARRFESGDFAAIADCPLVLNSIDDIGGHIERSMLKRAGVTHPQIMATSSNAETLLALCLRGVGACFCPEILIHSCILPN